ncbi:MAG: hypothetical protein GYB33_08700 [Gammaproteobacteria bacterium]|nr:hypothetical protein [Gammaproteobacteria bacterium]
MLAAFLKNEILTITKRTSLQAPFFERLATVGLRLDTQLPSTWSNIPEDETMCNFRTYLCLVLLIAAYPLRAAEFAPIHSPDKFAWDLFIELSHPALKGKPGMPDTNKKLGDDGETVWESWARAQDVFRGDGCKPGDWGYWLTGPNTDTVRQPASKVDFVMQMNAKPNSINILFDPKEPLAETRMNKEAYDFIVENGLHTIEGQEAFHEQGKVIDLPIEAREIKSAWRILNDQEARSGRFHTHRNENETYGLIALHIITKDLPQWFWSTFEHVDNPDIDVRDLDNDVRWLDRHTNGGEPDKLPVAIQKTKWQNYRLKGTQVDFVSLDGRETNLANAIIERGFMGSSSCISCHARATIGPPLAKLGEGKERRANRLPIFEEIQFVRLNPEDPKSKRARFIRGWMGAPTPDLFYDSDAGSLLSPTRKYTQTDFMWSFFRAQSSERCEP